MVQLSHPYMTTGKTVVLPIWTFLGKVMSLLFNMLFRLVTAFLPRRKRLNFMAAVTICSDFGAQENKVCHCFRCFPITYHEVIGLDAMIFIFWMLSFKTGFSISSFTFIFSSSSLSAISVVSSAYLSLLIFLLAMFLLTYDSSSSAFRMMFSVYKLNKQGDNIQSWFLSQFWTSLLFHVQF